MKLNLTDEQKKKTKADLGVLILTIMIGFWIPLMYLLDLANLHIIIVSFIMLAYSAILAYMGKFAREILGVNPADIPELPILKPEPETGE